MADEIDEIVDGEDKKSSKLIIVLVTILIILIWLAIFALLIKLDVGGFGSKVLRPILKDVPVINQILPEATDEEVSNESKYPYTNLSDAIARIEELENENLALLEAAEQNRDKIVELSAEVARLTPFETYQRHYEELKRLFDEKVVFGNDYIGNYAADPENYLSWYEELDKENLEALAQEALERRAIAEEIQNLSDTYAKMKAAQAAAILEEMTGDEEKVAMILRGMAVGKSAEILANMDSVYAAKITLLMYPSPYTVEEYSYNRQQEMLGRPIGAPGTSPSVNSNGLVDTHDNAAGTFHTNRPESTTEAAEQTTAAVTTTAAQTDTTEETTTEETSEAETQNTTAIR